MDVKTQIDKYVNENPVNYMNLLKNFDQFSIYEIQKILGNIMLYVPDKIFKYYSLTDNEELNHKKFSTLENKEVYLSYASDFNDIFDSSFYHYNPKSFDQYKFGYVFKKSFVEDNIRKTRLASFSKSENNSVMWTHYAHDHHGYCVSYLTNSKSNPTLSTSLRPVQYSKERVDVTEYLVSFLKSMEKHDEHTIHKEPKISIKNSMVGWVIMFSYYIKDNAWAYEQEFRVTKHTKQPKSEYMEANPSAIYVGYRCKDKHIVRLVHIAFQLNIPIYKMEIGSNSQLVPKSIC